MEKEAPVFNLKSALSQILAKDEKSIFKLLVRAMEDFHGTFPNKTITMREFKLHDNKSLKGRTWEVFTREWLIASQVNKKPKYVNVWLLSDVPQDVLVLCGITKIDSGIDIVAELETAELAAFYDPKKHSTPCYSKYIAVQCKFRSPDKLGRTKRLPWESLGTSVGLCALTGPWAKGIIVTNAPGLGRKDVPVNGRFTTLAYKTFDSADRDTWLRICGIYNPRRLNEKEKEEESDEIEEKVEELTLLNNTEPSVSVLSTEHSLPSMSSRSQTREEWVAPIHTLSDPKPIPKPKTKKKRAPKKMPEGRILDGWDKEKPTNKQDLRDAMVKRFENN